jgi:hypothetical protein
MNAADQEIITLLKAVLDKLEEKIDAQANAHRLLTEEIAQLHHLGHQGANLIPLEHQLWDNDEVGRYLHRSPKVVRETLACLPSFPKAIRLPSKGVARPLYIAADVITWAKKHKEKN